MIKDKFISKIIMFLNKVQ